MPNIAIKTSTRMGSAEVADAQRKLVEAYEKANPRKPPVTYEIVFDASAPTLEAYGNVARQIKPAGDQGVCYAIYLAAIAAGVPENIAYAAYLVCLAS